MVQIFHPSMCLPVRQICKPQRGQAAEFLQGKVRPLEFLVPHWQNSYKQMDGSIQRQMYWPALQSKHYCEVYPASLLSTLQHLTPVMSHFCHSLQLQQKNSTPEHNLEEKSAQEKLWTSVTQVKFLGYCDSFCCWKKNPTRLQFHDVCPLVWPHRGLHLPSHDTREMCCAFHSFWQVPNTTLQDSLLLCLIPRASFEPGLDLEWQVQEAVLLRYRRTSASEACSCFVIMNI